MSRSSEFLLLTNEKASQISQYNLTQKVESDIISAFEAIHALGVYHGDISVRNILVAEDGKVWVVDFEVSEVCSEHRDKALLLSSEMHEVKRLLEGVRTGSY
jgi:RIO-like serine/threonine protein kinase